MEALFLYENVRSPLAYNQSVIIHWTTCSMIICTRVLSTCMNCYHFKVVHLVVHPPVSSSLYSIIRMNSKTEVIYKNQIVWIRAVPSYLHAHVLRLSSRTIEWEMTALHFFFSKEKEERKEFELFDVSLSIHRSRYRTHSFHLFIDDSTIESIDIFSSNPIRG